MKSPYRIKPDFIRHSAFFLNIPVCLAWQAASVENLWFINNS